MSELKCDFNAGRDAFVVRTIWTLKRINDTSSLDFWKEHDPKHAELLQWIADTQQMPPAEQIEAVRGKLRELNRDFDGTLTPRTDAAGAVTELYVSTDKVADLSPVRALSALRTLTCAGLAWDRPGRLVDLAPLRGLALTTLNCRYNNISDLAPLSHLDLTSLDCQNVQIADLAPLRGLKLTYLHCGGNSRVTDLSPLRGMPLTSLRCWHLKVADLSPLAGMPLTNLGLWSTLVSDLSPLKGMKLTRLGCNSTPVADLSPLQGMPLTVLDCRDTLVTDLAPLARTDLQEFSGNVNIKRDGELLRSIKTLVKINGKPAAGFLKDEQAKDEALEAWIKQTAALPVAELEREVGKKLRELNPKLTGAVTAKTDGNAIVELSFSTNEVSDISPVQALTGLRTLRCVGSSNKRGRLIDLWPLKDMAITNLDCRDNQLADLSTLKNLKLVELRFMGTNVADLAPLKDMKLNVLGCSYSHVADLSVLKGMPLGNIACNNAPIADLSPLAETPLNLITCSFNLYRDAELLRSIKTLQTINFKPADVFWKETDARQAPFEAWCREVASLPVAKQSEEVGKKLRELNRGFDGKVTPIIEGGVVTGATFSSDSVTDLAPLRALPGLKSLSCNGKASKLADLWPLKSLKLTRFSCDGTSVTDLSPLTGMPLTSLSCRHTPVADLSPLKDMKLEELRCSHTKVADLSPLAGIPLTDLDVSDSLVTDLTPLKGMKLESLSCARTQVADLSPLKGILLISLNCNSTRVADLSPLKDALLTELRCRETLVVDLSPLKEMSLAHFSFEVDRQRDGAILRSIKTLETINGLPASYVVGRAGPAE